MPERSEEETIITEDQGELVALSNGKKARVRPLSVGDLLAREVCAARDTLWRAICSQLAPLFTGSESAGGLPPMEKLSRVNVLGPLMEQGEAIKVCFGITVDVPLHEIPGPCLPLLLEAFVRQNFPNAQLMYWAGLLNVVAEMVAKASPASKSTSATPARSSSSTDTPAGGSSPLPNSNTGSGEASGATNG